TAPATVTGINIQARTAAVTLNWGTTFHLTSAAGTEYDYLDAGLSTAMTSLVGMNLTVTGPNGFT
ncbi:MAG: hypothetical protein PHU01_07785, partial [Desulfuromonadaceae bacterium]|nr:hypothetical protein [Desulfuromonadaceae bacterium]